MYAAAICYVSYWRGSQQRIHVQCPYDLTDQNSGPLQVVHPSALLISQIISNTIRGMYCALRYGWDTQVHKFFSNFVLGGTAQQRGPCSWASGGSRSPGKGRSALVYNKKDLDGVNVARRPLHARPRGCGTAVQGCLQYMCQSVQNL